MPPSKSKTRHGLLMEEDDFAIDGTLEQKKAEEMPLFKIVVEPPKQMHNNGPSKFPIVAKATPMCGSKERYFARIWSKARSKWAEQTPQLLDGKLYFVFMAEATDVVRESQQFLVRLIRESDGESKNIYTREVRPGDGQPRENYLSKSAFQSKSLSTGC